MLSIYVVWRLGVELEEWRRGDPGTVGQDKNSRAAAAAVTMGSLGFR